jgi:uncharacterized protein YgfB (UPF0149 family)
VEIEYSQLGQELQDAGVESEVSEVQGLICGLFCSGSAQVESRLAAELFPSGAGDDPAVQGCADSLRRVIRDTRLSISGGETGYALLLPSENAPLQQRATALRDWCVGFLFGFGLVGGKPEERLSAEAKEALADLTEITKLDLDEPGDGEEDEAALMEVAEFVWVAATLIHDEIVPTNRS